MNLPFKKIFLITLFVFGAILTFFILDVLPYQSINCLLPAPVKEHQCKGCNEVLANTEKLYVEPWRQNHNHKEFVSQLNIKCNGSKEAFITQANTPLHSVISFSGEPKSKAKVTQELFDHFVKELPFTAKTLEHCSVVGNGGILANSKCGKQIDSAQFVFRCNIPPLGKGFKVDVGNKTDVVTANPSIFHTKYGSLKNNTMKELFVEKMRQYGSAHLLLDPFFLRYNTQISLRAAKVLKDLKSPIKSIFTNPSYLKKLSLFWRSRNLKENRISTGLVLISMALELCDRVEAYGFWPFAIHPQRYNAVTNHYYDDVPAKSFHSMPSEFAYLLHLQSRGVLRIHLGDCWPSDV